MFKDSEKESLLSEERDRPIADNSRRTPESTVSGQWSLYLVSLLMALLLSTTANAFFLLRNSGASRSTTDQTAFAHLSQNVPMAWLSSSPFYGGDEAIADEQWDAIDINNGSIALSDEFASAMDLPISQRFPWDDNKGIYILNGYHSMHCLKTIRSWVNSAAKDNGPHEGAHHIFHCLDALRQDVLCYADDTPRYTGHQPPGRSGTGQMRQCRDWSQMETWAQQNSACWRYLHDDNPGMDILEEFKYCPEGSPYVETMRKYFGE